MIKIVLFAASLVAISVAGCTSKDESPSTPPCESGRADILSPLANFCSEAANWPPPESDADWEALIKSSRYWTPREGLAADTCVNGALGFYAMYLDAACPDKAEADRRYNLMVQRALGGSP